MSRSSKSKSGMDAQMEGLVVQFCTVTGAPAGDAKKFLEKNSRRLEAAINAYYNDPSASKRNDGSTSKLNSLFGEYKDPDSDDISIDGTIKLCEDLNVNPEDVVMLAVAFELESPRVGQWTRKGWITGWKKLGCDSLQSMGAAIPHLRDKLGSDPSYFQSVYNRTFDFARTDGQRSLAVETAQAFWALLLPHGLHGGALSHMPSIQEDEDMEEEEEEEEEEEGDDDDKMDVEEGWKDDYTQWWFEYLNIKGGKGISRDTWVMFLEFVRTIDAKFENYDLEAAWPSTIDDFVEWVKVRLNSNPA